MKSIVEFMSFFNENWSLVIIFLGLATSIYIKIDRYLKLTKEQKIEILKEEIENIMTEIKAIITVKISNAEIDWMDYKKSGSIKRSQVLQEIFENYPILLKVANINDIIAEIDDMIDDGLEEMREIVGVRL